MKFRRLTVLIGALLVFAAPAFAGTTYTCTCKGIKGLNVCGHGGVGAEKGTVAKDVSWKSVQDYLGTGAASELLFEGKNSYYNTSTGWECRQQ